MSKIWYSLRKFHVYSKIICFDRCPLGCDGIELPPNKREKAKHKIIEQCNEKQWILLNMYNLHTEGNWLVCVCVAIQMSAQLWSEPFYVVVLRAFTIVISFYFSIYLGNSLQSMDVIYFGGN